MSDLNISPNISPKVPQAAKLPAKPAFAAENKESEESGSALPIAAGLVGAGLLAAYFVFRGKGKAAVNTLENSKAVKELSEIVVDGVKDSKYDKNFSELMEFLTKGKFADEEAKAAAEAHDCAPYLSEKAKQLVGRIFLGAEKELADVKALIKEADELTIVENRVENAPEYISQNLKNAINSHLRVNNDEGANRFYSLKDKATGENYLIAHTPKSKSNFDEDTYELLGYNNELEAFTRMHTIFEKSSGNKLSNVTILHYKNRETVTYSDLHTNLPKFNTSKTGCSTTVERDYIDSRRYSVRASFSDKDLYTNMARYSQVV